MLQILTITGPIYLLIALGYAIVRLGLMSKADTRVLGRFVFLVGMPALLFHALTQRHGSATMDLSYIGVYGLGSVLVMVGTVIYARRIRKVDVAQAAMQGLTGAAANTAFIGYPVLQQLMGPTAGVALGMCFIVENILIFPVALALADGGASGGKVEALLRSLKSLVRNPLIWGMGLGLLFNLMGWHLPAVPERVVQLLSTAVTPLALFVVGGSLAGLSLGSQLRDVITATGIKLLVHPLVVGGLLLVFPPMDMSLAIAAVVFAAMPMATLVTVLAQRYHQEGYAAAALLVATVVSFVTITLLLMAVIPMLPASVHP